MDASALWCDTTSRNKKQAKGASFGKLKNCKHIECVACFKINFGVCCRKIKVSKVIVFDLGLDANDIRTLIINHK